MLWGLQSSGACLSLAGLRALQAVCLPAHRSVEDWTEPPRAPPGFLFGTVHPDARESANLLSDTVCVTARVLRVFC